MKWVKVITDKKPAHCAECIFCQPSDTVPRPDYWFCIVRRNNRYGFPMQVELYTIPDDCPLIEESEQT
jgi:hypothetical protein